MRSWKTGKFSHVYCNCNDSAPRYIKIEEERLRLGDDSIVAHCGLGLGQCPDCGLDPWIYIKKIDEPQ